MLASSRCFTILPKALRAEARIGACFPAFSSRGIAGWASTLRPGQEIQTVSSLPPVIENWAIPDSTTNMPSLQFVKEHLELEGFATTSAILSTSEVEFYRRQVDILMQDTPREQLLKSEMSRPHTDEGNFGTVTHVYWPSDALKELSFEKSVLHQRTLKLARLLMGDDMVFDYDSVIYKPAGSATETPFHQDQAYWMDLPDKRALTFWIALNDMDLENGCLWYGPRTHRQGLRPHEPVSNSERSPLACDGTEIECQPMPVSAGTACIHSGLTLHYSRGNFGPLPSSAYIINFRPEAMVEYERTRGFDHGRYSHAGTDSLE